MAQEGRESYVVIRRGQIEASLKLARTAAVGGLINAVIVAVVLWPSVQKSLVGVWTLAVVGIGTVRLLHAQRLRNSGYRDIDPKADEKFLIVIAALNGCVWAAFMAFAGARTKPNEFTLMAMLTGGMMGAANLAITADIKHVGFSSFLPLLLRGLATGNPEPVIPDPCRHSNRAVHRRNIGRSMGER